MPTLHPRRLRSRLCYAGRLGAALVWLAATTAAQAAPANTALTLPQPEQYPAALSQELAPPQRTKASLTQVRQHLHDLAKRANENHETSTKIVNRLAGDLNAIFAFVRDTTGYEAYPGVLRGAEGTLLARRGNAADRAILLAKLLEQGGFESRFAHGELPEAKARQLLLRTLEPRVGTSPCDALPTWMGAAFREALGQRARRDFAAVQTALGQSPLPQREDASDGLLARVRAHVWLQAKTDAGWVDLDPSFADGRAGDAPCAVTRSAPTLETELFQTVTIRVVAEMLEGEKLTRKVALEVQRPVAELADHDVFLMHIPGGVASGSVGDLFASRNRGEWSPGLYVDGKIQSGAPVAFDPPTAAPGFGGLNSGLSGEDAADGPTFVAEWLEIAVAIPGRPTTTTTRALVDRLPRAARSANRPSKDVLLPLERDAKQLPLAPQETHNLLFSAGGHDLAAWASGMAALTDTFEEVNPALPQKGQGDALLPFETIARETALGNRLWALLADVALLAAINDRPGARFYVDSPRIRILTLGPLPSDRGSFMRSDVVRQDVGVLANGQAEWAQVAPRLLWLGALEGALEHVLVARRIMQVSEDRSTFHSASASYAPGGFRVLRRDAAATLEKSVKNPDLAARLASSLAQGATLVVAESVLASPAPLTELGWWEIASDGQLRALLGADYGGACAAGRGASIGKIRSGDMIRKHGVTKLTKGGREYETLLGIVRNYIAWHTTEFIVGCLVAYAIEAFFIFR